jgi:predicted permease
VTPRLDRLFARLRAVFRKPALDAELDDELAHHLEMLVEENLAAGLSPAEARRRARFALGGVEQTRELHRETRGLPWLEQLGQDLRYTLRLVRRERAFACIAVLLVALGIGLNTTVFSLVNTVLLRPLPFAESDRLVWLTNGDPASGNRELSRVTHRVDTWEGLLKTNRTLDAIEAYEPFWLRQTYRLTSHGEPETIQGVSVSPGLFPMLGVAPLHGRLFRPEDAVPGGPPVIVLSHQLWQRRFGANPDIVGQTVRINNTAAEVIGVLPAVDAFTATFCPAVRVDAYAALVNDRRRTWGNTLALIGRMKSGVSLDEAGADLRLAVEQLQQQHPDRGNRYRANVYSLHEHIAGALRQPLVFLWVAAGLVLAIVGVNLGGLLLARGAARRKEIALRAALGAGRGRILRQLLTECGVLVAIGSLLGAALAAGFIRYLSVRSGVEIPLLQTVRLDAAALGFTFLLCVATIVMCGIAPAWRLSGRDADATGPLKEEGRSATAGRGFARMRAALVILEVALACGLAVSGGLMVRSFHNVLDIDLGYEPAHLIAARIDPLVDNRRLAGYLESILERVRALPAVEAAGMTDCIPVERDRSLGIRALDGRDLDSRLEGTAAHVRVVTPGLLGAMGTRLVAGQDFSPFDETDKEGVIILNDALARRFWPNGSAVGSYVAVQGRTLMRVVGVAQDVRHGGPEVPAGYEMYVPMRQVGGASWDLMVRTRLPVGTFAADLRTVLRAIDATLPVTQVRSVDTLVDRAVSSRRILVYLGGGFAAMALGLAALGLYGVISYAVAQRTREIGIRMALGATAAKVRREVVGRTLALALGGLLLGLAGALAGGRLIHSMLVGVSPFDPGTYLAMSAAVLLCALIAGYLPARRASRVDPMEALRTE